MHHSSKYFLENSKLSSVYKVLTTTEIEATSSSTNEIKHHLFRSSCTYTLHVEILLMQKYELLVIGIIFIQKQYLQNQCAYLRQVNFYRCPILAKFLRGHVWTVPGKMHVKFEV